MLLFVVGAVIWVGIRGWLAKSELEAAIPLAEQIKTAIAAGDTARASVDADLLAEHAKEAANLTSDPIWRTFASVPVVGPNLHAVGEAAGVMDAIASGAIVPIAQDVSAIGIQGFKPSGGKIDLAPLFSAQSTVHSASGVLTAAVERINQINTESTLEPVRAAVGQLSSAAVGASALLDSADDALTLAPRMLGADGPRNYLLIFQNPAELRSSGGISSALALVGTDNGSVNLERQESSSAFTDFAPPVVALPADTLGLFGTRPAEYVQNTTQVPQFDLTGQIASAMWTTRFGGTVDGVISFDPVALGYLLDATGPITLPTGDVLTGQSAVPFLLNGVYFKYEDTSVQDAIFASAAKAVFDRISSGDLDVNKLLDALVRSGAEGRFKIWSSHPEDQAVLAGSSLDGSVPEITADTTGIGVYLNDATGAKMDYYLKSSLTSSSELCRADGRPGFSVSMTLTNSAPPDASTALPEYVTGGGAFGVTPGNIKTLIYVYGPSSVGGLTEATLITRLDPGIADGQASASFDQGHPVALFPVELAPGETRTVTVDFLGQSGNPLNVAPQVTPGIYPTVYSTEIKSGFSGC